MLNPFEVFGWDYNLGDVIEDHLSLLARGLLEPALVFTFDAAKVNNYQYRTLDLLHILELCNRAKLRAASEPLPPTQNGRYVLYRGVAGAASGRCVRGLSWTSSLVVASWFALRFSELANPAVYKATVAIDDIFFYTDNRQEQEFVCRPNRCARLLMSDAQMKSLANQYNQLPDSPFGA